MDFLELERRFVARLRARVRGGEITERRLARLAGISQPHVHNVLKGKRDFSIETADIILHTLQMDLLDLLEPDDPDRTPPRD